MRNLALHGSAATVLVMTCASTAQFSGDYAPDTWTVTGTGLGGSSATFADDGNKLTLVGSDGGIASTIGATHSVESSGGSGPSIGLCPHSSRPPVATRPTT